MIVVRLENSPKSFQKAKENGVGCLYLLPDRRTTRSLDPPDRGPRAPRNIGEQLAYIGVEVGA